MMNRTYLLLALSSLLLACGPAQAATQGPRTLTSADIARIEMVQSARVSPKGDQVAYEVLVQRDALQDKDGPARKELHVLRSDGSTRRYIGGKKQNVSSVRWTPSGDAISFVAKRDGDEKPALYRIPVDGGEARRALSHGEGIGSYDWHPDGHQVAYLAKDPMDEDQKKLREKGFDANVYEESARPTSVWVGSTKGGEARKLELKGSASELHWSPNGEALVVALAPSALIDDYYMARKVTVVSAKDGKVLARVENPGKLGGVSWSPDGAHLAIVSGETINDPSAGRLKIVEATGGKPTELLKGYEGAVHQALWLDHETLLYLASEGTHSVLGKIRLDGTANEVLHRDEAAIYQGLSLSEDAKAAALVASTPQSPRNLYRWSVGSQAPEKKTTLNPWLAEVKLGHQKTIRYAARDGKEIEGILVHPVGDKKGKAAPMIVMVHGGPESHYRNGWLTWYSSPGQIAAGRGYAVFYPNYRGSTGRGVPFSRVSQGDPAGAEFDDIVDGVDHLVKMGVAKKGQVGITGGSYGGYASAWGATYYTDRFAASAVFVGVTDLVSKVGTTDIPQEMYRVHYGEKWPWEQWDRMLKRSPIYHADKSETPTLILHGEKDPRVDPGQGRELYRHLKLRGKAPVRLVTYPGEGHGNRRAASRLDYNLRVLRWMDHYLKGPGGEPPPYAVDPEAAMATKKKESK
jgi:dipeptidyl aminopeptidase/acylaminoacyl peptidase